MRIKNFIAVFVVLSAMNLAKAQDKKFKVQTIAFYNVENLFDTINNPDVNDEEYTPTGTQNWTYPKYKQKLKNLEMSLKFGLCWKLY